MMEPDQNILVAELEDLEGGRRFEQAESKRRATARKGPFLCKPILAKAVERSICAKEDAELLFPAFSQTK